MRVVIGEDEALLREGDVVAAQEDAPCLVKAARCQRPDIVVTDIRMPPEGTDYGLRAALAVRSQLPRTA